MNTGFARAAQCAHWGLQIPKIHFFPSSKSNSESKSQINIFKKYGLDFDWPWLLVKNKRSDVLVGVLLEL